MHCSYYRFAQTLTIYNTLRSRFVFGADTVGQLLDALPAEDFRPHLDGLERLLSWIEQHQVVEIIPDYCDPYTGQCYGTVTLQGWNSPHMTSTQSSGPAAWSTAQAITCIMRMKKVVQRLLHVDVLEEFRGTSNNGIVKFQSWDRLLDTDLGDPSTTEGCRTLKDVLNERMIQPFSKTSTLPTFGAAYSSILFGPPVSQLYSANCSISCIPFAAKLITHSFDNVTQPTFTGYRQVNNMLRTVRKNGMGLRDD